MPPSDPPSPFCSAIATAIVSAWTSKPTNFTLFMDRLLSLVALYCLSSDSQHNPRLRIGAGHSIVTSSFRLANHFTNGVDYRFGLVDLYVVAAPLDHQVRAVRGQVRQLFLHLVPLAVHWFGQISWKPHFIGIVRKH